uniref:Uncharacterized protein n=1 Tax=Phlebotomus papatasi TaxID=29031 RepID=A0A1B0D075_PHLPP
MESAAVDVSEIEECSKNDKELKIVRELKEKGKEREDERRGAKSSSVIEKGDSVLLKNLPGNKLQTNFGRTEYEVIEKSGPAVTVVD